MALEGRFLGVAWEGDDVGFGAAGFVEGRQNVENNFKNAGTEKGTK
jgi:hypothetical protein